MVAECVGWYLLHSEELPSKYPKELLMTVFHEYLEMRLTKVTGATLAAHVKAKRIEGMTWQQIADDLHATTGVTVSRETLRLWFPDLQKDGEQ